MRRYIGNVVLLVVCAVTAAHAQTPPAESSLQSILKKVRETYASLTAWQFEHRISIEETRGSNPAVKIADVFLTTANRVSASHAGISAAALCVDRCRRRIAVHAADRRLGPRPP